jgi:hypothetical protein
MTASIETMVRRSDWQTSYDAAASINENMLNDLEDIIKFTLRTPLADHELVAIVADYARVTPQRIRTIRNYLTLAGQVEFTGMYHLTPARRKAMVWQAVTT